MTLLVKPKRHTTPYPVEIALQLSATHKGQAHLAGTGPVGATCRQCTFWGLPKIITDPVSQIDREEPRPHRWRPPRDGGELYGRRCLKFHKLLLAAMVDTVGSYVPHDAPACRHFDQADNPPPIKQSRPEKRK